MKAKMITEMKENLAILNSFDITNSYKMYCSYNKTKGLYRNKQYQIINK